jgi:DNA-binding LytR/AlgR family response regulator
MNMTCYVVDDNQHAVDLLTKFIEKTPFLTLIGSTTEALVAVNAILKIQPELIFLDIDMPEITGVELVQIIHQKLKSKIIFTTASRDYAVQGFELGITDYLLKPISYVRFFQAASRAHEQAMQYNTPQAIAEEVTSRESRTPEFIFVNTSPKGTQRKIIFSDIDYIEGSKNYVTFHCGKEKILVHSTMKEWEIKLPASVFMRVHNSYIIPPNKVISIAGNLALLASDVQIPIGETYREAFEKRMGLGK